LNSKRLAQRERAARYRYNVRMFRLPNGIERQTC
jgi:hypothetical protein